MRSTWGRSTYGDPCRECGFSWSLSVHDAISVVSSTPDRAGDALAGHDPASRHDDLTWSALAYVCHITDNLRIWAERLAGAALGSTSIVSPYDGELLARARAYEGVPVEGALWSLGRAVDDWKAAVLLAGERKVAIQHPERGPQTVEDIALTNAHDAYHHVWDIQRSTG
jgi:hypothetical protein